MECSNIQEKLSAYIEDILPSEEKLFIDRHLESCQRCSQSLSDLRKTIAYVKNLEELEPPTWLAQKVMTRVSAEARSKKKTLEWLFYPLHIKLPIEIAATIAIAITTFYIFKTIPTEMQFKADTAPAEIPSDVVTRHKPASSVIAKKELPKQSQAINKQDSSTTQKEILEEKDKIALAKQSTPVPLKSSEHPGLEKKPEAIEDKKESEAAVSKKREGGIESRLGVAENDSRKEAGAPATKLKAAVDERKTDSIGLTLNVSDLEIATKEIEQAVLQFNGEITKTESLENKRILHAKISRNKFKGLFEKLKSIGIIKEKEIEIKITGSDIEIRMEIAKM